MTARVAFTLAILLAAGALAGCTKRNPTGPRTPQTPIPTFQGIGDLAGGAVHSEALAVSDDGRVVVGRGSSSHFDDEGFLTTGDSLIALLGPGAAPIASEPRGLTPDGAIVAGKITIAGTLDAARWTAATGWVGLPDLPGGGGDLSQALGISADGSVLVGWGSSDLGLEATRWVGGAPIAIGDLAGGAFQSAAALASADGGTIVGTGTSAAGPEVFVWTSGTGMVGLGDLDGGDVSSEPFGMTPDASVIVGEATSAAGIEAFRWTATSGMLGLGDLFGGAFHSTAFDVSNDGSIVVGFGTTDQGSEAFIWDVVHGMRSLKDVLLDAGVTEVEDWTLTEVTGISADGRVLVGNGINPDGNAEGWIVRFP